MDLKHGTWDPAQYLKFSDHRLRPNLELMDRIPETAPELVVDLGCGTGEITSPLSDKGPASKTVGMDLSSEMLSTAENRGDSVEWLRGDISDWHPKGAT